MKKLLSTVAVSAITLVSSAALAFEIAPYVDVSLQGQFTQDIDLDFSNGTQADQELDFGGGLSGAAGVKLFDLLRIEGEVGYQHNETGDISGTAVTGGTSVTSGDLGVWTFMTNAIVDIDFERIGLNIPLTQYFGGGIGAAIVDIDTTVATSGTIDDDDTVFAYQLMTGTTYNITKNHGVYLGYRFLGTTEANIDVAPGLSADGNVYSHIIEGGYRYTFNTIAF